MNAVLQQLYMIPHIRANLLSLPCLEEDGNEEEGKEGEEGEEGKEGEMSPAKLHHLGVAKQVGSSVSASIIQQVSGTTMINHIQLRKHKF